MKNNIILNITTSCNYNCSYCDVIKNNKQLSRKTLGHILFFIKNNSNNIKRFKFFGGEPLLVFEDIKYIIEKSKKYLGNNYEIVTNTSILTEEIGTYFKKYFKIVFFSIDTQNDFDYKKVLEFIKKYELEKKVYFNLIINPQEEDKSLKQFNMLYNFGFKNFNILPVYFTKEWTKKNLRDLSKIMKSILDLKLVDNSLNLYGFQKEKLEESKLLSPSFFIDIDGKIFFSDIISNNFGKKIKKDLLLGDVTSLKLSELKELEFLTQKKIVTNVEEGILNKVRGQKELIEIMDYFSKYLRDKKRVEDK